MQDHLKREQDGIMAWAKKKSEMELHSKGNSDDELEHKKRNPSKKRRKYKKVSKVQEQKSILFQAKSV